MRITGKINLAMAGALLVGVAAATFAMFRSAALETDYNSLLTHEVAEVELSRQMQVTFKKQVQAWKDILLRGSDPASLAKYSDEFFSLEKQVDDLASRLESVTTESDVREKLRDFATAHKTLGDHYRAGLEVFRASKGKDFATVDKMVKGQDRPPTDLIDEIVDELQKAYAARQKQIAGSAASARRTTIVALMVMSALALFGATRLSGRLTRGIRIVLERAEAIAACDLTGAEIKYASRDELGELATAVNKMQANLRGVIASLTENAQHVASASEEFSATSREIAANSEETSVQASAVSTATEEVDRNLQAAATSTEEMSATVNEIAKNAGEAARVAGEALKAAMATNATVAQLGESSSQIGQVIKVITAIAQQTNLLALNATIEAARAGEAGKGFAVVANEVKELAKQTAQATEDIARLISAIQSDAKGAVDAISRIGGIIGKVNDISGMIATAVEEQSATTSGMSRNLTEAAKGSDEVAKNITGVARAAQSTSSGATDSSKAAQQLAEMSTQMRELVGRFKVEGNGRHAESEAAFQT